MSDASQGPGWWLASDGRWYPPPTDAAAPTPRPPGRRPPAHMAPRKSRARWYALGLLAIIVVVVIIVVLASTGTKKKPGASAVISGPVGATTRPTRPPPRTSSTTAGPSRPASATPRAAAPPIVLNGSGQGSPSFTAAGGLTVLTAQYQGSDNFIMEVVSASGQSVDTPISTTGPYSGTVSESLNAGPYTLNVTASSAWTVTITQPRNQEAFHLPYVFNNGVGDALIGPFKVSGAYEIAATNRGQANFVVSVLDTAGHEQDVPINEVGNYTGSVAESDVTPGIYYLQINSNGDWTVNVSAL